MRISAGTRLGPYEITARLGAGGMGEVYKARDTRLDRTVAIKVLPEHFSSDPQRRERFQREAHTISALSHPNICALYDIGEQDGISYLVLEFIQGESLADRLHRGPVPASETLRICADIASALAAAHRQGVIHRDLKPANIMLTKAGAKLLDFGLAKPMSGLVAGAVATDSPTLSKSLTEEGTLVGTFQYMAPEQLEGKAADARTDIFALSVVLYEMAAGQPAFRGESRASLIGAIMQSEPESLTSVAPLFPPALDHVIRRGLAKDPDQRWQSAADFKVELDWCREPRQLSGVPVARTRTRSRIWIAVIAFVTGAVLVGVAGIVFIRPHASDMRFVQVTNFPGVQAEPAFSPDGRSVAFVSNRDGHHNIYVGLVGGGKLIQITSDLSLKSRPRWSPDGTMLAYCQLNDFGLWDVWEVPALGGTPRRLILGAKDPAWSPDGRQLAYEDSATISPDGRRIAFIMKAGGPYGALEVVNLDDGKVQRLTKADALALSPAWSPDGEYIYFASSRAGAMNIWKMFARGGTPVMITSGQGDDAQLDVSADGKRIAFSTYREYMDIAQLDMVSSGAKQAPKPLTEDPARNQMAPEYSPDGQHLAYFSNSKGVENESIWVTNSDGSNAIELVHDRAVNVFPRWTADSRHLIYQAELDHDEYRSAPISGGAPTTLMSTSATDEWFDVGADGRLLFLRDDGTFHSFDSEAKKDVPLGRCATGKQCFAPRWSPNQDSFAYIVKTSREDDPDAGIWVNDVKGHTRQIFRGWAVWYARGFAGQLYVLEGKGDLEEFCGALAGMARVGRKL